MGLLGRKRLAIGFAVALIICTLSAAMLLARTGSASRTPPRVWVTQREYEALKLERIGALARPTPGGELLWMTLGDPDSDGVFVSVERTRAWEYRFGVPLPTGEEGEVMVAYEAVGVATVDGVDWVELAPRNAD